MTFRFPRSPKRFLRYVSEQSQELAGNLVDFSHAPVLRKNNLPKFNRRYAIRNLPAADLAVFEKVLETVVTAYFHALDFGSNRMKDEPPGFYPFKHRKIASLAVTVHATFSPVFIWITIEKD
jgi:hypothetical protein